MTPYSSKTRSQGNTSAMNQRSSKDPTGSGAAPKIDAETEEKIYQWVKLAMDSRTEEEVKWEEDNFPDIDTLNVGRAKLRAQIWGTPANGETEEEQQPKKTKGKGRAPKQAEEMEKAQTSTSAAKSATENLAPFGNSFRTKEEKFLMEQIAGYTVHVEGLIRINAEKEPEMAAAYRALAAVHGWKPVLPARIGHVEFRAVWDLEFTISVAPYSDMFELMVASDPGSSMSEVDLSRREKPCCEIQLGAKHAPFFHFVQAYLHMHLEFDKLLQEIWTIPSRYGRAECIIRNLVYIGNLIGDSEEFGYLDLYVNQMWDALRTWGFCCREIGVEADGHKDSLLFHHREQFRALYDAAQGTALRFFAIETVERAFINAAHHPASPAAILPEWIEEDFLNDTNSETAMCRDDLREFRELHLCGHRATSLKLPWPKYYTPRPDLATPKPFVPLPERNLQPPNGDSELEEQPWLARAGIIPSAAEVRKTIEALTKGPSEEGT